MGALVASAAVIRALTIDNQSMWMDEALTAYEAQLPFGAMIHTVATVEVTPPLYFLLVWASVHLFGPGTAAVRLASSLAGIAIVPIAYLTGRELVSRWAGVLAAALTTVSPFLVWYSQEGRAYILLATLTAASFLWFIRAQREPSRRNLAWWAAFSSSALLTHFFAGFVIAPEALWLLVAARSRRGVAAVACVALVQAAILPLAFLDTSHGPGWIAASSPRIDRIGEVPLEFGLATLYRTYSRTEGLLGAGILTVIVVALLAAWGDHPTRRAAALAAIIGGAGVLTPLILGIFGPDFFLSRNLTAAWFPLLIVVVAACAVPRARLAGGMLAAALLVMSALATADVQTNPALQRPNYRRLAQAIGDADTSRAIVASAGLSGDPLKIYLPGVDWVEQQKTKMVINEIDVVGQRRRQVVLPAGATSYTGKNGRRLRGRFGVAMPLSAAPPGTRLLDRFRVDGWVVARFAFRHPMPLDIVQLIALTPRFYGRAPTSLLVFFQRPERRGVEP